MTGGVSIQLIEERYSHRQKGIGKQLDGLGLGRAHEQHGDVFFQCGFFEQAGEDFAGFRLASDHDPRRMQIVIQCATFAQEFRREEEVQWAVLVQHARRETHGDRRFDDDVRIRVNRSDLLDHGLDRAGIEIIGFRVVIRRGADHNEAGTGKGVSRIVARRFSDSVPR